MKCTLQDCPGEYENLETTHVVTHRGQTVVIENVPAEICDVCGDVLFTQDTARHIERLLNDPSRPVKPVSVHEYV